MRLSGANSPAHSQSRYVAVVSSPPLPRLMPCLQGTEEFMSMRLLNASKGQVPTIHTALDDLESFLWVLIWGVVHASKDIQGARDRNLGIKLMLEAWEGDNRSKYTIAKFDWTDVVFGRLIDEWVDILSRAHSDNRQLIRDLPKIPLDNQQGSEWSKTCDRLEAYCTKTYEDVLKSGFNHLKRVERYSTWEEVVAANAP